MGPPAQEPPIQTSRPLMRVPLSIEDQHWVKVLRSEIWKDVWTIQKRVRVQVAKYQRSLTHEEWQQIQDLITRYTLPCEMVTCGMGFQIGMLVYNHSPEIGIAPKRILLLQQRHLPKLGDTISSNGSTFAFTLFSPLTHSKVNRHILRYYCMDPPRSQSHFEY